MTITVDDNCLSSNGDKKHVFDVAYSPKFPDEDSERSASSSRRSGLSLHLIYTVAALAVLLCLLGTCWLFFAIHTHSSSSCSPASPALLPPSHHPLPSVPAGSGSGSDSRSGSGAVTTNTPPCARVGRRILTERNGSFADAAIATLLCESVASPQSLGLAGGFVATIYLRSERRAHQLNARENAPLAAHADMFANQTAVQGTAAIGVPGAVAGYWALHQRYGRLPWAELFQPAIELCAEGAPVSEYLAGVLRHHAKIIRDEPTLAVFVDPQTADVWRMGQRIRMPAMGRTLEELARGGVAAMYTEQGVVYRRLQEDLAALGGSLLVAADFTGYRVRWTEASAARLERLGATVYSSALPATGFLAGFVVRVMEGMGPLDGAAALTYHWLAEAYKWAFARRTELADAEFVPEVQEIVDNLTSDEYINEVRDKIKNTRTAPPDHRQYGAKYTMDEDAGTAHINILAPNGDAISVTSTLNDYFGTKLASVSTGLLLNNQMDDFANPGIINTDMLTSSPRNRIAPGKQPLSSLSPTVVVNDRTGDVRMLIGGAGGTKITTLVAMGMVRHLLFNQSIAEMVREPRFHHQLMPYRINHEQHFNQTILRQLSETYGHRIEQAAPRGGFGSLLAIGRDAAGIVSASFDARRGGSVEVF